GGWQMRIALARALMAPSELLLLDEPTNHLDLDAMLWLERWIAGYEGTVLIISHDTEFLNACARHILHFDQCKLVRYRGDYDSFLTQRAERLRQSQLAIERQTREAARLQAFIDRFKAKATKAKQAQSRIKALARMEVLAPKRARLHEFDDRFHDQVTRDTEAQRRINDLARMEVLATSRAQNPIDIQIPNPDSLPGPLLFPRDAGIGYAATQPGASRTPVSG